MDERDINIARHSIEDLEEHEPVLFQKHNSLGRMFKVKKEIKVCMYCQEEWPCYAYENLVRRVVENLDSTLDSYEVLRQSFDRLTTMQSELLTRTAMAAEALNMRVTNLEQTTEVD